MTHAWKNCGWVSSFGSRWSPLFHGKWGGKQKKKVKKKWKNWDSTIKLQASFLHISSLNSPNSLESADMPPVYCTSTPCSGLIFLCSLIFWNVSPSWIWHTLLSSQLHNWLLLNCPPRTPLIRNPTPDFTCLLPHCPGPSQVSTSSPQGLTCRFHRACSFSALKPRPDDTFTTQ